ncbi:hypothetical protein [Terriglobus sp.]|uniref:hypothetical protein n=1 Tax=Terriglobus sp. TaxID=1889013 RepID=UPI003B00B2FC
MITFLLALSFVPFQASTANQQFDCKWDDKALPCEMKTTTAHYTIAVYNKCKEGTEYTCRDYVYTSVDQKGRRFTLQHGRMAYRVCPYDNITPCEQQGWVFRNGNTEYLVRYPTGTLEVRQGDKLLLREEAISVEP